MLAISLTGLIFGAVACALLYLLLPRHVANRVAGVAIRVAAFAVAVGIVAVLLAILNKSDDMLKMTMGGVALVSLALFFLDTWERRAR